VEQLQLYLTLDAKYLDGNIEAVSAMRCYFGDIISVAMQRCLEQV
jgi:hypothetical protein